MTSGTGQTRFTREAQEAIEAHVQRRLNGRVRNFHVSVVDGGLVLRGLTHSYYAKQLIQHAVMEAIDLPIHANEIEVL
jgi:hypothetical protein